MNSDMGSKEKVLIALDRESSVAEEFSQNVPERGHWSGRFDFILACLGTTVGFGNFWRFPYLCYRNGGGAFVIPYVIMVFLIGMPVVLVELTIGQYSALGPSKLFGSLSPIFRGLGYAMIIVSFMVAVFFNMIIAWTLFYFFDSFRSDLQWQYCHHDFNTDFCFNDLDFHNCKSLNSSNVFNLRTCFNSTYAALNDLTDIAEYERVSPSEEYFFNYVLGKSNSLEEYGTIRWPLVGTLLVAWVIVVLSLLKGIKTLGRVLYFTATFPCVILVILFIRGVTLEGAANGIYFYLVPEYQKLREIRVWKEAATQVFYSFSIAGGGMITYASYNKFRNNLIKDVFIIVFIDTLTSLFSGLVVFSMVGFMAVQLQKSVPEVVNSGIGLAFIAYPNAIARMPGATVWALLFFFMLLLLGIDNQFAFVETIITFVFDEFPSTRKRKSIVVCITAAILFLLGLTMTTNGGIYVIQIMDVYAAGQPYLVIGLIELVVVAYVYGMKRFMADFSNMTGWKTSNSINSHLLMIVIITISAVVIGAILLLNWINFSPLGRYTFPVWADGIGWAMTVLPISMIPFFAIYEVSRKHTNLPLWKRLCVLTRPTDEWRANARANSPPESSNSTMHNGYDSPAMIEDSTVHTSHL